MRVVGLLRGVNIGKRQLKMAELRATVESLGHTDVETYLQSGNVVFTPAAGSRHDDLGAGISAALTDAVGMDVQVLIRTAAELQAIVAGNPYDREDPTKVVVTFLSARAEQPDLDLERFAPEGLTTHGREIYLDLPSGQARSPLLAALAKATRDDGRSTSRNWRTVQALCKMANR